MPSFWLAREDFIDGQQDLIRFQVWAEVTQRLDGPCRFRLPGSQHPVPVGPGHALGRTDLLTRQCRIDRCIQCCWPSGTPPRLRMGHALQLQAREVIAGRQRSDLGLFGVPDDLAMGAHEAADRRVGENRLVVGLPAEQAGNRDEGQILGQQTSPFLEAAGDDNAVVRGKDGVARNDVGLRLRMGTDLAGKVKCAEATGDGYGLVAVSVDRLRGKKPDGAGPSARRR